MAAQQPQSSSNPLPDVVVMNGFHQFLVNALGQAKLEKLLDEDTLASAEADVMICGPALCLFFAALRSNTNPPSVPIPGAGQSSAPLVLNAETCPPVFRSFFRLWSQAVPDIQALPSNLQHDLARIICDREPLTQNPAPVQLNRIAADLRSVAIEITQRRTFQERYQMDLQRALDVGQPTGGEKKRMAAFVPPPSYDESPPSSQASPVPSAQSSPRRPPVSIPATPSRLNAALPVTPHSADHTEGMPSIESTLMPPQNSGQSSAAGSSGAPSSSASASRSRPVSPTLLPADGPAINLIRETLYAALAEVIATTPGIKAAMATDPARAYFSSVALSILTVASDCMTEEGGVLTPLGKELTLAECPDAYKPLMMELGRIEKQAKRFIEEDNDRAIEAVKAGRQPEEPRMERLKRMLEHGVAREEERYDSYTPAPSTHVPSGLVSPPGPAPPMPIPTMPGPGAGILNVSRPPQPILAQPAHPPEQSSQQGRTSIEQTRRSVESARPSLEEDPYLRPPGAGEGSSRGSSPYSSADEGRSSKLRNLLRKPKPASPPATATNSSSNSAPAPPPKPLPPANPPNVTGPSGASQQRYPPPSSPPHTNMAGVGSGAGHGLPQAFPQVPGQGRPQSPPRAAMMQHQATITTSGNAYDHAGGSGARVAAGDEFRFVRAPNSPAAPQASLGPPSSSPPALPPRSPASNPSALPPAAPSPASASATHAHSHAPAPALTPVAESPEAVAGRSSPTRQSTTRSEGRRSLEGTTVQFANTIQGLALRMTRLRMFQERQDTIFKILISAQD